MAPISRNDHSNKSTHILMKKCARIKMVLIDSHGYSTQTGTHALLLSVVIYALLLCGQHQKLPATRSLIDMVNHVEYKCSNTWYHRKSVVFQSWTLPSICYFSTSKGCVTWIIQKVNRIPTHCGVAYDSVRSLARGHMITMWLVIHGYVLINKTSGSAFFMWLSRFYIEVNPNINQRVLNPFITP